MGGVHQESSAIEHTALTVDDAFGAPGAAGGPYDEGRGAGFQRSRLPWGGRMTHRSDGPVARGGLVGDDRGQVAGRRDPGESFRTVGGVSRTAGQPAARQASQATGAAAQSGSRTPTGSPAGTCAVIAPASARSSQQISTRSAGASRRPRLGRPDPHAGVRRSGTASAAPVHPPGQTA